MACSKCEGQYRWEHTEYELSIYYCKVCGRKLPKRPPPKPRPPDECPTCRGVGTIYESDDSYSEWTYTCERCKGTGKIEIKKEGESTTTTSAPPPMDDLLLY